MPKPRAVLVAFFFVSFWALVLAGCGQVLGLGSLHDRSEDGGESAEGGGDGTVDTGVLPDGATDSTGDQVASDAAVDSGDGSAEPDALRDGEADSATDGAHTDGGDSGAGCVIGGTSYASGAADPNNACQSCQPGVSASTWSNLTDGASCGSNGICRTGACVSGCEIGGVYYATNAPDPSNACQSCQPGTSTSAWTPVADGTGCASGKVCSVGACTAGCFVGGSFYAPAAANPANACQSCQPGTSTTAWSNVADGTSCSAGKVCTIGACTTGCFIGGSFYASAAADPNNACQSCQPATSTTAWSNVADGTGCGNGQVCASGACGTQCDIGGTIYTSGTVNPGNSCQSCQPGLSTSAWSALANGTGCASGEICNAATCTAGCFIGGTFYGSGVANPSNSCQSCQPATSTSAWTTLANGASCGSGVICNAGTCSNDCLIGGVFYTSGTVDASNSCLSCQPTTSTSGWSSVTNGTMCGTGGECQSGACVCDATSCAKGCCNGQTCVPWASEGSGECGTGGRMCGSCPNGLCDTTSGTCSCDSNTCGSGCCNGGPNGNCVPFSMEGNGTCGMGGATCGPCSAPTPVCLSGGCVTCSPGQTQCAGAGYETCQSNGTWGSTITPCTGTTPVCVSGACVACTSNIQCMNGSCDTSTGACTCDSNDCSSGCCSGGANGSCVSPPTPANCGSNGNSCMSCPTNPANGSFSCSSSGTCLLSCVNPYSVCTNSYCANLGTDPNNCGSCAHVCPAGPANSTPDCVGMVCGWTCNAPYNACGGASCLDLQTDPLNCGACGHSCQGGTCSAGLCQPISLCTSVHANGYGVAVDATSVYFTDWPSGSTGYVEKCALGGGAASVIYTVAGNAGLQRIIVDKAAPATGYLYFGSNNQGTTYAITTAGALVFSVANDSWGLATDGSKLYLGAGGGLFSTSKTTGGTVTNINNAYTYGRGVAWDSATNKVWVAFPNPNVMDDCPTAPGSCTAWTLSGAFDVHGGAGTGIFFMSQNSGLYKCNTASDCSTLTQFSTWGQGSFADDLTNVYFADYSYNVYYCPVGGCSGGGPIQLSAMGSGNGNIQGLTTDATWLYWITDTGKVYKVVK